MQPDRFRDSYAALLLTLPALICVLAAERAMSGLPNTAGLFEHPLLALAVAMSELAAVLALPALLRVLAPRLARGPDLIRFVVLWNWTGLLSVTMLAIPAALFAIGWSNPGIATIQIMVFAAITARLRYLAARAVFGHAVALPVLGASLLIDWAAVRGLGLWGF